MTDQSKKVKKDPIDNSKYSLDTHLIYGKNISKKWDYSYHVTAPISSSTTFRLDSVERGAQGFQEFGHLESELSDNPHIYIYDRLGEPNKDMLEENLADVEGGEMAVTFASGMGAISGVLGVLLKSGDEIITHKTLYGCTISLFNNWYPKFNINVLADDLTKLNNFEAKLNENVRVIYFETPANPNLDIIDIPALRVIVDKINKNRSEERKIKIVVDNTFATPYCQRPLTLGADFVVHSLTKGIGGFGADMGGVVIGPNIYRAMLLLYRKDFGGVLNTKSAWAILTYGLPSLALRQRQQIATAMKVAEFLENHPKVEFVNYPGLKSYKYYELAKKLMIDFDGKFAPGSMIFFALKGNDPEEGRENGRKLMNYIAENAYTMTLAVSLGHTRTLIEHPASMTHSVVPADKLIDRGINPGGVRLAIGIETADDIILDLKESLEKI
ncbi:MAG: aminotransferase class I/II-fold pyridoxal phosphate-dependent enzyme [Melioribacteraceae bacterium]|nr:aminotransferase class I/II-fold pyridoxal phosphate-dependent enzyme [Melioribacteraceae bacterium]